MGAKFDSGEFYSRQTTLSELGPSGQRKLGNSNVAIVGLGGLGSVSALYLALAGVRKLTLIDQDTVEMNNLHRQVLYSLEDIRYPKVEAAARRIKMINPEAELIPVPENLDFDNAPSILEGADCIVDGLDNMRTRYIINRYCVERRIPLVFGGAIGMEGNVAVFKSPETACLECVLPGLNDVDLPTCDTRGVLGATTGIVGAIQAMEAIKTLTGIEPDSKGRLLIFDFAQSEYRTVHLSVRPDCEVCQARQIKPLPYPRRLAWLCGSDTANVNPEKPLSLDLQNLTGKFGRDHTILLTSPMVIVFYFNGHEVSLFRKGRMLIKNVRDEKDAQSVFNEIIQIINKS